MSTINPFGRDIVSVEKDFCGKKLSLEVGRVGFRSSGSVLVRYGETVVLGTAQVGQEPLKGFDYFPLSIDYEEKMYAAGKISGSRFIKREGRPSDEAVLIGRLIDRPIRPLWPKGYRHEVQGVATVLSMDPNFRPDAIAMIALSTAFMLTGAPFEGPIAGVRVGLVNGEYKAFAKPEEYTIGKLDLVVAGTEDGIMMVEAGANEVSESEVVEAMKFAHQAIQPAIELQKELLSKLEVVKQDFELDLPNESIVKEVEEFLSGKMGKALRLPMPERHAKMKEIRDGLMTHFKDKIGLEDFEDNKNQYSEAFSYVANKDVRSGILDEGERPDGRKSTEVRQLSSEIGFLPRVHGSSLFTRGLTQAMNIVTLAPLSYAQVVDTMERDEEKRYMHHYNAPGYTVGEVRRLGSPGRREIGHSALAERALLPVIPGEDVFPYTIRSVTEIMSQNGSTSMAATCASCLSLMDAGVPIKSPVSGIAMGLMTDGQKTVILSDIADAEDFAGDMDFKVAGTSQGITALQMDMKVHGLKVETLSDVLNQAKDGRAHILQHMVETIANPRDSISKYAPQVETIKVNPDKVRDIIGKGGETINKIIDQTGAEIDIRDGGLVMVSAPDEKSISAALKWINDLTAEPEVGKIYENCRVVSVMEFGIFVEIMPGKEGLVHVSEMSEERVNKPSDLAKEGDKVTVKLVAIDDRDRLVLSMKQAKEK